MLLLASFGCGFIFGWGLLISGMVKPEKVLGFLDIFGAWDPSLAVVMAAALAVSTPGFVSQRAVGRCSRRKAPCPSNTRSMVRSSSVRRCSALAGALSDCARVRRLKIWRRFRLA
jgi:uncharacterized membrane protein YedE/YeeE